MYDWLINQQDTNIFSVYKIVHYTILFKSFYELTDVGKSCFTFSKLYIMILNRQQQQKKIYQFNAIYFDNYGNFATQLLIKLNFEEEIRNSQIKCTRYFFFNLQFWNRFSF